MRADYRREIAPEMELLVHCARPELSAAGRERVREIVACSPDWEHVLKLAEWHRLLPLVHWHLREHSAALPQDVRAELTATFRRNAEWALRLSAEVMTLVRSLDERGIAAVSFKGVCLAAQVYGNLALRAAGDIDIVVREEDVPAARELLRARGYQSRDAVPREYANFVLHERYSEDFDGPGGITVELHWTFTNGDIAFPVDVSALFSRAAKVRLGGSQLPGFANTDLLLLLCVHGVKHRWNRLEWLGGVCQLIRECHERDLVAALGEATRLRVRRRFLLMMGLAHSVFDIALPASVGAQLDGDRAVRRLTDEVAADLLLGGVPAADIEFGRSIPGDWLQMRISDSFADQLRLVHYRATTPSRRKEWRVIPFGRGFIPLHAIIRPLALIVPIFPALWWTFRQRTRFVEARRRRAGGIVEGRGENEPHA